MISSVGNLMFKLPIIFVVNIKFPRATYHTIVPLTEKLYFFNIAWLFESVLYMYLCLLGYFQPQVNDRRERQVNSSKKVK